MDKKLTVIQVIPRLEAGGAETGCVQIAEALVAAGHRALVISEGGRQAARLREVGGELIKLPVASKNPLRLSLNAGRIARLVRDEKADILHARSRAPAWSCLLATRKTKVPFVTTYHSGYSEKGRLKNVYNSVMARCDRVIAVSEAMADLIRERYHPPETRIAVIHRGADEAHFDPAMADAEAARAMRASWGAPEDAPVVLLAGRITRRKAQDVLIAAMGLLKARGVSDFHAVCAGDNHQGKAGYFDQLQQEAARLGIGGRLHFPGHVADIRGAYAASDISLCISSAEGFPRAALESQAMGLPVIVSDIGPGREVALTPPDVAEDEASGARAPYGDAAALADALAKMLDMTPDQRAAMGRRGGDRVRRCFTISEMQRKTLALYHELAGETG